LNSSEQECLWKVKSKDYYNRSKKNTSYQQLVTKVKVKPGATQDTFMKKNQQFIQCT